MRERLILSAKACLANAERLLDDAEYLAFGEPPATSHFLCSIAEEEVAKAFLLALVVRDIVPWKQQLLRAARDHTCKQLLSVVMEYLSPDTEEFLDRCNAVVLRHETREVPKRVIDAIRIFRFEKIGRWQSRDWAWVEQPEFDRMALDVADGKLDRQKQDRLYVRLSRDGSLASIPAGGTYETVQQERDRVRRMTNLAEAVLNGDRYPALDFDTVEDTFKRAFAVLLGD